MTTPDLQAAVPLADTPRPPLILTPELNDQPDEATLDLLRKGAQRELGSDEVYTVTNCDYVSPEGPNYLMTIKPYYWEVEPGKWEPRDGYQNRKIWPSKQQKQLESMSQAVYTLCLASRHLSDLRPACLPRLKKLLRIFFVDHTTRMMPEAKYVQCVPSHVAMEGDHAFIISMRFLILVSRGLSQVELNAEMTSKMVHWFKAHVAFLRDSRPGQRARDCGDNKTVWYHAVLASHLSYIDPSEAKAHATSIMKKTMKDHPTPVDLFRREVNRTRPLHYSIFILEPLFLLASSTVVDPFTDKPEQDIRDWLSGLVAHAHSIPLGAIEGLRESQARTAVKLGWFEKMLSRWEGSAYDIPLDDNLWEKGWNETSRLLWGLI